MCEVKLAPETDQFWNLRDFKQQSFFPISTAVQCRLRLLGDHSEALTSWLLLRLHLLFLCCSVAQLCPTLCDPTDCSIPGFPVFHHLLESVMASNHLILCRPLLLPSIFPSIRVFSNESAVRIRWPNYKSFSFCLSLSNEYSGLTYLRIDWLISLQSKGLLRVFSSTTVQMHQILQHSDVLKS